MKVRISITDDKGKTYEGEVELRSTSKVTTRVLSKKKGSSSTTSTRLDFGRNQLAFMNKYARHLPGPNKFALLVAHLAKGQPSQGVTTADVEKNWNKMKGVLGKYNPAYPTRAKANGWVNPEKHGTYVLSSSWTEALK